MPTLNKQFTLEVTPEQFIRACSDHELYELHLLMCSPAIAQRIDKMSETINSFPNLSDGQ